MRAKKNSSVRSILLFYISVSVTGWRAGGLVAGRIIDWMITETLRVFGIPDCGAASASALVGLS